MSPFQVFPCLGYLDLIHFLVIGHVQSVRFSNSNKRNQAPSLLKQNRALFPGLAYPLDRISVSMPANSSEPILSHLIPNAVSVNIFSACVCTFPRFAAKWLHANNSAYAVATPASRHAITHHFAEEACQQYGFHLVSEDWLQAHGHVLRERWLKRLALRHKPRDAPFHVQPIRVNRRTLYRTVTFSRQSQSFQNTTTHQRARILCVSKWEVLSVAVPVCTTTTMNAVVYLWTCPI